MQSKCPDNPRISYVDAIHICTVNDEIDNQGQTNIQTAGRL